MTTILYPFSTAEECLECLRVVAVPDRWDLCTACGYRGGFAVPWITVVGKWETQHNRWGREVSRRWIPRDECAKSIYTLVEQH